MRRAPSVLDARALSTRSLANDVGKTPLVVLSHLSANLPARVAVKLESRNPTGSVKDRVAAALVGEAEEHGLLYPGCTLVAATSGNTGLALARIGALRGYRVRLTIPAEWSSERLALFLHLGADVVVVRGNMGDAVSRARDIAKTSRAVLLDQFTSMANTNIHRETTSREIWDDTAGEVAAFVAGVGSGGTLMGVASGLRARRHGLYVVAVEPSGSPVLSGGTMGTHRIQGIGAGFVPPLFEFNQVDEVLTVSDEEAFECTRRLALEEGILAGVSSGACVASALRLAQRKTMAGKLIVTMVSDSAERYVISPTFNEELIGPSVSCPEPAERGSDGISAWPPRHDCGRPQPRAATANEIAIAKSSSPSDADDEHSRPGALSLVRPPRKERTTTQFGNRAEAGTVVGNAEASPTGTRQAEMLEAGELTITPAERRARVAGQEIALTTLEFKLLLQLVEQRELVQSRRQLLIDVWEADARNVTRTVDTHVKRLRLKLGMAGRFIQTVRGLGYRFSETPSAHLKAGRCAPLDR
jgi:cysteine synthase A